MSNPYLESIKEVVGAVKTRDPMVITGAIVKGVNDWLEGLEVFTDEDEENILAAVEWADSEYVKPINLPGPDSLLDPIVSMGIQQIAKALIHFYRDGKFSQAA